MSSLYAAELGCSLGSSRGTIRGPRVTPAMYRVVYYQRRFVCHRLYLFHNYAVRRCISESRLNARLSWQWKVSFYKLLNNDAAHLINGVEIDRPRNALTLTHDLHQDFGRFDIFFTAHTTKGSRPNTYRIETFLPAQLHPILPITRTPYLTEGRTTSIEPPIRTPSRYTPCHRPYSSFLSCRTVRW